MDIIIETLTSKLNLAYLFFSLLGLHINFIAVKKLLLTKETPKHVYAIITSMFSLSFIFTYLISVRLQYSQYF